MDWVAYHDETNWGSTEEQTDKQRANFKHLRDASPFAIVSYFNYVSNFRIMYDFLHYFYMVKFFQWWEGRDHSTGIYFSKYGKWKFGTKNNHDCHFQFYSSIKGENFKLFLQYPKSNVSNRLSITRVIIGPNKCMYLQK